jgi:4-hydroxy-tetrahydrodipicolinate synthase
MSTPINEEDLMAVISGIVPPVTTPFDDRERVHEPFLRAEIRHLVGRAGVHGLAVGGSTGEGHALSIDELRSAVGVAVEEVGGRVPVVAGIIVDSTQQAIERGRALADLDVAALQVTPVHYLFRPDDEMMVRHFASVADQVGVPVIVYNVVPWAYCSPCLLARMIRDVDGVIGVKQSASDLKLLADLLLDVGDQGVIMSAIDALLYPSFCLGAHGAIAAILAAVPELCLDLWQAVQQGAHERALGFHQKLLRIWNVLAGDNLPANVKCALDLQGRPAGRPRAPMPVSSPAQKRAIEGALRAAGVIG